MYTHPCDVGAYPKSVGPTVEDLAEALAAQLMHRGTQLIEVVTTATFIPRDGG